VARKSIGYRILIWALLIASLLLLWRVSGVLTQPKFIPTDDFVRHWAAGRLFFSGDDPYSPTEIQVLQDQVTGQAASSPVITPNYIPPWTMPLLAFFGLLDYPTSRLAWLLFNVAVLFLSTELLWKIYGGSSKHKWIAWVVCFSFAPTISVLGKGQTSCLILLGIAGFLYFTEHKSNGWIAGAFAALITIKPQVFYLFWPIFLFWLVKQRKFKPFLGCGITILLLSAIVILFNQDIFFEYWYALKYHSPSMFATPTIGGYLRYFVFGIDQFWLQFIPSVIGLTWGAFYLYKNHSTWLWSKEMPLLLFASILTSSYSWTYDQVVLVVPVIQAWGWVTISNRKWKDWLFVLSHFLLSFFNTISHRYWDDFWFIWFAPATLLWYLLIRNYYKTVKQE
jgi:hypothetical protein